MACENGHCEMINILLNNGANVDPQAHDGNTPLQLAIMSSENLDAVTFMLEHKADILHKNREGRNPLHLASRNQNLEYMKLLFELDLTGCGRLEADSEGTTVIHSPVESSSHEMVLLSRML